MEKDNFKFDLNAKKIKATDEELLASLKEYANIVGSRYFSESEYNKWKTKMPNQESKKSYEFFAPKVFIRTFGWPFVSALQYALFVL